MVRYGGGGGFAFHVYIYYPCLTDTRTVRILDMPIHDTVKWVSPCAFISAGGGLIEFTDTEYAKINLRQGILNIKDHSISLPISGFSYRRDNPENFPTNVECYESKDRAIFTITDDYGCEHKLILQRDKNEELIKKCKTAITKYFKVKRTAKI